VIIKLSFHDNKASKLWNIILRYIEQAFLQFPRFFSVCLMSDILVKIIRARIVSIQGWYKDGFMWKLWNCHGMVWVHTIICREPISSRCRFWIWFHRKNIRKVFSFLFQPFFMVGNFFGSFSKSKRQWHSFCIYPVGNHILTLHISPRTCYKLSMILKYLFFFNKKKNMFLNFNLTKWIKLQSAREAFFRKDYTYNRWYSWILEMLKLIKVQRILVSEEGS
jgi:hypothetical protein